MKDAFLEQVVELLRETFEGGLPGQGTQYLDHDRVPAPLARDRRTITRAGPYGSVGEAFT